MSRHATALDRLTLWCDAKKLRLGLEKDEGILEVVVWDGRPRASSERAREVVGAADGIEAAAQRVLDQLTRR